MSRFSLKFFFAIGAVVTVAAAMLVANATAATPAPSMSIDQVVAPTRVVPVQNGVPVNEPPSAAVDAAATVRHEAPIGLAHAQLKLPLGSLALSSSPSGIREAGLTATVGLARPKAHLSLTPGTLSYRGGSVKFAISASNATRCTLSSKPRIFAGPNPQRVRCRAKQTLTLPAVAVAMHWSFKFTARNARGQVAVARRTLVLNAPPFALSTNWAGYVVPSSRVITQVSGRFTVPTLNCSRTPDGSESTWVGTGGAGGSSGDLLQTGVESDCVGGSQVDNPGWWEEYPEYPAINFTGMSVSPGDQIEASVYQSTTGRWITRLDDLTTGVSGFMGTGLTWGTSLDSAPYSYVREGDASTVSYSGGYTAEWIVEDFGLSDGSHVSLVPFADFGTVAFTNLTTRISPRERVGLHDSGNFLLAAPSTPDSSGNGFSVTYTG